MIIRRLQAGDSFDIRQINQLVGLLGERKEVTKQEFVDFIANPNVIFHVAVDQGRYAGTRHVIMHPGLGRWVSWVHDLVVHPDYRGLGVGEGLARAGFEAAREFGREKNAVIQLYATSNPARVASNNLTRKLGYTLIAAATDDPMGTNLYKKVVTPDD